MLVWLLYNTCPHAHILWKYLTYMPYTIYYYDCDPPAHGVSTADDKPCPCMITETIAHVYTRAATLCAFITTGDCTLASEMYHPNPVVKSKWCCIHQTANMKFPYDQGNALIPYLLASLVPLLHVVWLMPQMGVSCGMANRDHCPSPADIQQAIVSAKLRARKFPLYK